MMTRSVYDHAHFHRQQCCQSVSFELGHISHFILYIKKESTCIYLPVKIKHYLIEFAVSCMNLHVFAKVIHQTLNNEGRIYSVMHLFASYLFTQDWLQGFLSNHCYSTKGSNTFKDCDDFFYFAIYLCLYD